jgi:hypothetical protein
MGISRIADGMKELGARFDFVPHPTIWNSSTPVPNVTVPSGYHPWECASDYSYYAYRYELLWKDEVYADVSFTRLSDEAYLLRCEYINNTDLSQNCLLNLFSSLEFPEYEYIELITPEKCTLKDAGDYEEYEYAVYRPWDRETPDGLFRGQFRDKRFYRGFGLGDRVDNRHTHFLNLKPFGAEKGDRVSYKLNAEGFENPVMHIRYRTEGMGDARFTLGGEEITLPHSKDLRLITLPFCENPEFVSLGGAGIELDFIAVTEKGESILTEIRQREFTPEIKADKTESGYRVKLDYPYEDCEFCIYTHSENTRFRTLESGSLEDALINRLSNGDPTYDDLCETFSRSFERKKSDEGFFQNTLIKSIFIEPHSSHTEYMVISKGEFDELSTQQYEEKHLEAKERAKTAPFNKAGEKYALSTSILRATLLTNAVYPVYLHGENVVHHAPGKRWDSFYTWDSGFIGMGLLEVSPELCLYALDMYLCDDSNRDFAFLLHGSLVPTQFYEYIELLKRSENKNELSFLYKKAKRYYEFLRGRGDSSSFAKFGNGLLTAYDYWYSCSGMDDYPAQVEMIKNKAEAYSCPCLTTAQVIRVGKIMRMIADSLGLDEDIAVYESDITISENALNALAWDEESGYFGYTMYDKEKPYIMKTEEGENWNRGFDGIYPLISGSVDGDKKERLLSHLKNPKELWTKAGLSAVDRSAPYYIDDGYWNGNVWMSHQWFIWKTMLDIGEADFAFKIADTALDMWREETDFSYHTYECFGIETRRGGWFHNFGGLSAPINIWANAYYKPETVTSGFDVWTDCQHTDKNRAEIKFRYYGNSDKYTIIVTLSDDGRYRVTLDGREIPFTERVRGCIEITLDNTVKGGVLLCQAE